jgi:TonB-linked SusC/RagA family outer membrane protein
MNKKWIGLLGLTLGTTYLYAKGNLSEVSVPLADLPEQTGEIPPTTGTLRGRVTDAQSVEAVIGATIRLQDGRGVITNYDGDFQLESVTFPAHIKVSYVGYKEKDITVKDASSALDIRLEEEQEALKEVVVVGYGTQKRTQLTGSVVKITADDLHVESSTTIDAALSGAVAGLNVTASSGQPGAASNIRIRGGNSVNASNEPLYVIDGFIYYKDASASKTGLGAIESSLNPLSTINPADIASIEVLKDISATAIYGSRGANGVILITTKKGTAGKTKVNYRYTAGFDAVSKKLDLMNAQEWAAFQKKYYYNKGGYTDEEIATLGDGTDWQDAMLRTAFRQSHEVSINGGTEKGRYAFSANYTNQDGVIINSGFKRYNFHLNADWKLFDGFTYGISATYGKSTQNGLTTTEEVQYNSSPYSAGITNSFVYGLLTPQVVPVYAKEGGYNYSNPYEYAYFAIGNKTANAVSDLKNSVAESINNYLLSNVWAQYRFGDFTAKVTVGLNKEQITQNYFSPSYTSLGLSNEGLGGIGNKSNEIWQEEYTLSWGKQLGDNHYVDALAGYTYQNSKTHYNSVLVTHFTNEDLKYNNLADGSSVYPPKSGATEASLNSFIARVNYTLLDRYNATATLRADNSSRFAKSHRWGYSPSLGISWNADRESFIHTSKWLDALKVRASIGVVGNQEIGDYDYSLSYTAGQYDGSSSYSKNNAANDNLKWETTTSANIGVDWNLFNNRLSIVADVYYKKTKDLLLEVPMGFASGVSTQLQNVGNVVNKGIEFSADLTLLHKKDVDWSIAGNIAHNKNEITDMGSTNNVILGSSNERILRKGEALGSFYGLVFDGIVQSNEDPNLLPTLNGATLKAGEVKYRDLDGNGRIDGNDRTILGSIQPDITFGLSSRFRWKRLDVSIAFAGSVGNELFNALGRRLEQTSDSYNLLRTVLNSWTTENASNTLPYAGNARSTSYIDSRYVEDASYLKLRNLAIGYTVPLKNLPVGLRVFATGSNLFTVTHYSGYDPEVSSGTDSGAYPASRTVLFGVDLSF